MASFSAEVVVIFIASLFVAAGVASVTTTHGDVIGDAIDADGVVQSERMQTDIVILTDPAGPVYDTDGNENITLHVKNSGSRALEPDAASMTVLVDNNYIAAVTVTPLDGDSWNENEVVRIEISVPGLDTGDHRVKLSVRGDDEVFKFRVDDALL